MANYFLNKLNQQIVEQSKKIEEEQNKYQELKDKQLAAEKQENFLISKTMKDNLKKVLE